MSPQRQRIDRTYLSVPGRATVAFLSYGGLAVSVLEKYFLHFLDSSLFHVNQMLFSWTTRWWSKDTIAVVTGSNKGLGFAIVQGLALKGVTTILTSRDEQRGLAALNSLKKDQKINPETLHFHVLDALRNQAVVHKISNIDKLSVETLDEVAEEFIEDVEHGQLREKGWSGIFGAYDYCVSKLLINAYSRAMAWNLPKQGRKIFVNCMCPGLTSTDMLRNNGHSPQAGAETAIWLAFTTGRFFSNKQDVGFDHIPLYLEKGTSSVLLDEFNECSRTAMPPLHPVFLEMY
ncbi:uncharacterized protein LOC9661382 [Selaginella moellendorffii]|uniref:uncharacterized protein LOC9661382 n=1 Tax=Selaginella moellendorffii TaxID=88036 RepID=UPI000D1C47BE|nr:uncharacterized protein LOC9661382 [Selaginella moellendorffii]|eukprot:XP_024516794.1 uncharacterized protein LOC9661382 [Selaginella moellendorffii]